MYGTSKPVVRIIRAGFWCLDRGNSSRRNHCTLENALGLRRVSKSLALSQFRRASFSDPAHGNSVLDKSNHSEIEPDFDAIR